MWERSFTERINELCQRLNHAWFLGAGQARINTCPIAIRTESNIAHRSVQWAHQRTLRNWIQKA